MGQIKKSVDDFTNNTEKKSWFYQEFMKNYNKLPAHLRTKYDAPVLAQNHNLNTQNEENIDYQVLLTEIASNPKLNKPAFKDIANQNAHYVHNRVTPPVFKKRKLNDSEQEHNDNNSEK